MKLKIKKPWWVPGWIWNRGVDALAERVKKEARVDKITAAASDKTSELLEKAVQGKDPAAVAKVCSNCKRASDLFGRMSAALEDSEVSTEERAEIADIFANVVWGFVDQDEIDAKIDEIAAELRV